MRTLATILTTVLLVVLSYVPSAAQACGNIYARFTIRNVGSAFLQDSKLELLRRDGGGSILYDATELEILVGEHAFSFRHGLCGSHTATTLVLSHPDFERFEAVVDLPLNTPSTEHVFFITPKPKGSREKASIEQWASLAGFLEATNEASIKDLRVNLRDVAGKNAYNARLTETGYFSFSSPPGIYELALFGRNGKVQKSVEVELKPGLNWAPTIKVDGRNQ